MDEEEFQRRAKQLFYRTANSRVGERAQEVKYETKNGISGKFTNHLLNSGMWRNNGLNTRVDTDPFLDGSKDWMDKIN